MTRSELKQEILDDFTSEYYQSNLCSLMDSMRMHGDPTQFINELEEAIFELCDDFSASTIETMDRNCLIKKKDKINN